MFSRKGSGMVSVALVAAVIIGLISLNLSWIFSGMFSSYDMMSVNARADSYAKNLIDAARGLRLSNNQRKTFSDVLMCNSFTINTFICL